MTKSGGTQADFDGIICIGGEDWWYHNRGHFDFQVMRRLAKRWPVLFVNSLGVRMPSVRHDRQFAQRIGRKLKSFARGLVEAEPGFWVFSPVTAPGRAAAFFSSWALGPQIRIAARRAGIRRPLLWVHCPAGAALIDHIPACAVVLQRTDRFEAFPEADRGCRRAADRATQGARRSRGLRRATPGSRRARHGQADAADHARCRPRKVRGRRPWRDAGAGRGRRAGAPAHWFHRRDRRAHVRSAAVPGCRPGAAGLPFRDDRRVLASRRLVPGAQRLAS